MAQSTGTGRRSRSSQASQTRSAPYRAGGAAIASAAIVAGLLAIEIARLTTSATVVDSNPRLSSSLAPQSPWARVSTAMADVGIAAAKGSDPPPRTLAALGKALGKSPNQSEPFLVRAALAQRAGDLERARSLLLEARRRDPRSSAARYLLADVSLRQGRVVESLEEMAVLSRLVPGSSVQLVPALSEYAKSPGAQRQLQPILEANPSLKPPLLGALAVDPANTDLVIRLAGRELTSSDPENNGWKSRLLDAMIGRGQYARAYAVWQRMTGIAGDRRSLLFNGDFRPGNVPPPFNWSYFSSGAGVAEPAGGHLRVLYYGREDSVLARQLLLLPPGAYDFSAPLNGQVRRSSLIWTVRCEGDGGAEIMRMDAADRRGSFTVPQANCDAQRIQLEGNGQDIASQSDVQLGPARLERSGN